MSGDSLSWRRPPAPSPYRRSGGVLKAPRTLLGATLTALQSVGRREAACLWLGTSGDNGDCVHGLIVPKQTNQPLNYAVDARAMQAVAARARPRGWTLLANVHSHPGVNVEHSAYDDQMMPSQRALSIVLPSYGRGLAAWPSGVGVHEFIDNYWHLLPEADARTRVQWLDAAPLTVEDLR